MAEKSVHGSCIGQGTHDEMILEVQAPDRACFEPLLEAFCASFPWGQNVAIVITGKPTSGLTLEQTDFARSLLIQPKKLTKAFFMSVPPGKFLVSNVYGGPNRTPSFAAYVSGTLPDRLVQWRQITVAEAAQRTCYVFPSQSAFEGWDRERRPPSLGR